MIEGNLQCVCQSATAINILFAERRRCNRYEKVTEDSDSPIIRKGAARLIPINSMPRYMASPKAAAVDIQALMLPNKPSSGFERTVSRIMHVKILGGIENDKL